MTEPSATDKPLVLVLMASAGAGHILAARALEQALHTLAPHVEVEVLDVLTRANRFFRWLYGAGYLDLVRYSPAAFGWLYDAMDRPPARWSEALRTWFQGLHTRPVARYVRQRRPSLVINTHFLPAEIVAELRRAGELHCPQIIVTTDYETHRMWVQEPAERYYAATDLGQTYLTTWGVPPERVLVTGIPIRPGFATTLPQDEARRRCGLDAARPVVLLLCGGFGVGPIADVLRELVAMRADAQVVAIAGRNEALRKRLEAQSRGASRPVRVVGFTDQMHEWMQAADLVVTKPGGLTVAESLACGLPLVIINPIPGQEERNSDYLLEQGAAIKVNNLRLIGYRVSGLLADPARLQTLRTAARTIARPQAARDIATDALRLLSGRSI